MISASSRRKPHSLAASHRCCIEAPGVTLTIQVDVEALELLSKRTSTTARGVPARPRAKAMGRAPAEAAVTIAQPAGRLLGTSSRRQAGGVISTHPPKFIWSRN
jgi:hypothetical protein